MNRSPFDRKLEVIRNWSPGATGVMAAITTIGSETSSLLGSIFAEWHLPEVGPFPNYAVSEAEYADIIFVQSIAYRRS
jgi:hypothetical protein